MQTKSALNLLVHNYRAVLQKCFWTNAMNRQDALKSLSSKVNRSAFAGLLLAAMSLVAAPAVADTITLTDADGKTVETGNSFSEISEDLSDKGEDFFNKSATLFGNVTETSDGNIYFSSTDRDAINFTIKSSNNEIRTLTNNSTTSNRAIEAEAVLALNLQNIKIEKFSHESGGSAILADTLTLSGKSVFDGNAAEYLTADKDFEGLEGEDLYYKAVNATDRIRGGAIYVCGYDKGYYREYTSFEISGEHIFSNNKASWTYTFFHSDDNRNYTMVGGDGGAVYVLGNFIQKDSTSKLVFENNFAQCQGGAICVRGQNVELAGNNEFISNTAVEGGGAIQASSVTLSGKNTFDSNVVEGIIGLGGAIYAYDDVTLSGENLFEKNESATGGAITADNIYLSGKNTFKDNKVIFDIDELLEMEGIVLEDLSEEEREGLLEELKYIESTIYGGAIAASGDVVFSGDGSEAIFEGNTAKDKANDIFMQDGNLIFRDKGTYTFDGGIISYEVPEEEKEDDDEIPITNLYIGCEPVSEPEYQSIDTENNVFGGTNVTFKNGAINLITGVTQIAGKDTVVKFENEVNDLKGGMTISDNAKVSFSNTLKVYETVTVTNASLELGGGIDIVFNNDTFGSLDLTGLGTGSFTITNLDIDLIDSEGETLTVTSDIAEFLAAHNGSFIVVDCADGNTTFSSFETIFFDNDSLKLSYKDGDIVLDLVNYTPPTFAITITNAAGEVIAQANDFSDLYDSTDFNGATIELSGDVTQPEPIVFKDDATLTIKSDIAGTVRTITMSEDAPDFSEAFIAQTSSSKTLTLNLSDVKFTGGKGCTELLYGGAIYSNGSLELKDSNNVTFEGNEAEHGGALYGDDDIKVSGDNKFVENEATIAGGALATEGLVTLSGKNTFTSNTAGIGGGAIYSAGITISGESEFKNNQIILDSTEYDDEEEFEEAKAMANGGAIYSHIAVIFSGDESKATFTGNKVNGKANDIFTIENVIFGGKGTYSLDGGIVTNRGGLHVGYDFDFDEFKVSDEINGGTKITFEKGAINEIAGLTQISGEGTHVRFNNADNKLKGGLTVDNNAKLTIAGNISVGTEEIGEEYAIFDNCTLEFAFDGTNFGKLDLTQAESIAFSNVTIDLVNYKGETLTVTNDVSKALANGGIVLIDGTVEAVESGESELDEFVTIEEGGFKIAYENGDIVVSLETINSNTNEVADEYNSASAQGSGTLGIMSHNDMIGTAISNHIMGNVANNHRISMITLDETSMMASTSGVSAIAAQNESGAFSVWGEALYSYSEYNGSTETLSTRESSYGGLLGFEQVYSDVHYGLFVGAVSSDIDGENSSDLESEAIYGGAYAGFRHGMFVANFGAMVGYAMNDASRIGAAGEITGEYDSYMGNIFGEVGAYIELTEQLYTQATIGLQYTYVNSEDYNEEGNFANHVDSNDFDSLNVSVDARLGYKMSNGFVEARAGVAFELLETSINSHFNLLDNPATLFSAQGGELDSMKFILGVDAGYYLSDNVELRGGILGEVGDESERVTGNVRLIYTF